MAEQEFPMYKGKPLVRCGDVLYYGSMADKYVVRMQIKSKKTIKSNDGTQQMEIADKVGIQLMSTSRDMSPRKQIIKTSEKSGLYLALDLAEVWLRRAIAASGN